MPPHLRVARPTDRLAENVAFYRDALGLSELGSFHDHDGFDGVMLGWPGAAWHLELTHARPSVPGAHAIPPAPTKDNLLVIYLSERAAFDEAVARVRAAGCAPVAAFNPYWDRHGVTFEDPDGWRVVLQNAAWTA